MNKNDKKGSDNMKPSYRRNLKGYFKISGVTMFTAGTEITIGDNCFDNDREFLTDFLLTNHFDVKHLVKILNIAGCNAHVKYENKMWTFSHRHDDGDACQYCNNFSIHVKKLNHPQVLKTIIDNIKDNSILLSLVEHNFFIKRIYAYRGSGILTMNPFSSQIIKAGWIYIKRGDYTDQVLYSMAKKEIKSYTDELFGEYGYTQIFNRR